MARLITKVYGDALFDYAKENDVIEKTYEESNDILYVLKNSTELKQFLNNPIIAKNDKKEELKNIFTTTLWKDDSVLSKLMNVFKDSNIKKGKNTKIFNFLNIIIDKGRFNELEGILEYFIDKVREYKGIGFAEVCSAYELDDIQKKALENKLIETTNYNSFVVDYDVDDSLISGLKIKIKDKLIDSTLKTKIADLSKNLRGVRV